MLETVIHSLGLCGEPHFKLLDIVPFYSYIIENTKENKNMLYFFKGYNIYYHHKISQICLPKSILKNIGEKITLN